MENIVDLMEPLKRCPFCGNVPETLIAPNGYDHDLKILINCKVCNYGLTKIIARTSFKDVLSAMAEMRYKWDKRVNE